MISFIPKVRCDDLSKSFHNRLAQARNVDYQEFILSRKLETVWGDPNLLVGMENACDCIINVMANNQKIMIFADYDVDGVSSAYLLTLVFRQIL
jgi:single-stranded-DNA-specific exonuclease